MSADATMIQAAPDARAPAQSTPIQSAPNNAQGVADDDEYAMGADLEVSHSYGSAMPPHLDEEIPFEEGYSAGSTANSAAAAAALSQVIVLPESWASFSSKLPLSGMAAQLARQSECSAVSGRVLTLRVPNKALAEGAHADRLRTVLSEFFGFAVQLEFDIAATQGQTAHAIDIAAQGVRQEQAEHSVHNDPFIQSLVKEFGAQVVPGSIRPSVAP